MTQTGPHAHWRPSADLDTLRLRASLLADIRAFFRARGVLEVETPMLAAATSPETHVLSFEVRFPDRDGRAGWLQTSPEFAMKRLLCAESGPIYQITKAFRAGEAGRLHNPEFTIVEWYRPGFGYEALITEVEDLLGKLLNRNEPRRLTYREAFRRFAGLDPKHASLPDLRRRCRARGWQDARNAGRDACLDFLLDNSVQSGLSPGIVTLMTSPPRRPLSLVSSPRIGPLRNALRCSSTESRSAMGIGSSRTRESNSIASSRIG